MKTCRFCGLATPASGQCVQGCTAVPAHVTVIFLLSLGAIVLGVMLIIGGVIHR